MIAPLVTLVSIIVAAANLLSPMSIGVTAAMIAAGSVALIGLCRAVMGWA